MIHSMAIGSSADPGGIEVVQGLLKEIVLNLHLTHCVPSRFRRPYVRTNRRGGERMAAAHF